MNKKLNFVLSELDDIVNGKVEMNNDDFINALKTRLDMLQILTNFRVTTDVLINVDLLVEEAHQLFTSILAKKGEERIKACVEGALTLKEYKKSLNKRIETSTSKELTDSILDNINIIDSYLHVVFAIATGKTV